MTPATLSHIVDPVNAGLSIAVLIAVVHQNTHRVGDSAGKHWWRQVGTLIVAAATLSNVLGSFYSLYWRFAPLSECVFKLGIAMLAISWLDDQHVFDSIKQAHRVKRFVAEDPNDHASRQA